MLAASEHLYALYNNKKFILNAVRDEILALLNNDPFPRVAPQAINFGMRKNKDNLFYVRTVIWSPPLTKNPKSSILQNEIYSYGNPHDHNFSLLTIGYKGEGYGTKIYEYDREKMIGYVGEHVPLTYLETTELLEGKIIYFRPLKDVHLQFPPREVSISLNLIGEHIDHKMKAQFEFDIKNQKIMTLLQGNLVHKQIQPFEIIKHIEADAELIYLVSELALKHPVEYARSSAYKTLSIIAPTEFEEILSKGFKDNSALVKHTINEILGKF